MHMLLARSVLMRGMQQVAGMLSNLVMHDTRSERKAASEFNLVSWTSSAHSRREDELARIRLMQTPP
jgi:hypothetical protein